MTTPDAKKLIAAAYEARDALEVARQRAHELLNPDPVEVLADVIADRDAAIAERDRHSKRRNEMSANLDAVRGLVGRHELPIVDAVCAMTDQVKVLRADLDALRKEHAQATDTVEHLRERRRELKDEVERLTASLSTAEADAETQRTAAADLRDALDRVAEAAGVGTDSTASIVADRVIAVVLAQKARPVLTVERLADALRAANVTLQPTTAAFAVMAAMSHMGDLVLSESPTTSRPAALPADLRTYLETRRDRLQGGHGLGLAAEIAALKRWIALPTAEVAK